MADRSVQLRYAAMTLGALAVLVLIAAGVVTLYLDLPKAVTWVFGLAAGFGAGSLLGMVFVQSALNGFIRANTRPQTLDDIVRSRRSRL